MAAKQVRVESDIHEHFTKKAKANKRSFANQVNLDLGLIMDADKAKK